MLTDMRCCGLLRHFCRVPATSVSTPGEVGVDRPSRPIPAYPCLMPASRKPSDACRVDSAFCADHMADTQMSRGVGAKLALGLLVRGKRGRQICSAGDERPGRRCE